MRKKIIIKPDMGWQVKEYSRTQDFHFTLPYQFLLLCKLIEVPPRQLLLDFMDHLSCGSWKRQAGDQAKKKLTKHFLDHEYGPNYYSPEHTIICGDTRGLIIRRLPNMPISITSA